LLLPWGHLFVCSAVEHDGWIRDAWYRCVYQYGFSPVLVVRYLDAVHPMGIFRTPLESV